MIVSTIYVFIQFFYDPVQVIDKSIKIKDLHGREFPLQNVVSETLRYMKEKIVDNIKDKTGKQLTAPEDILFVLTVPAIWNDAAKSFMRNCAVLVLVFFIANFLSFLIYIESSIEFIVSLNACYRC